MEVNQPLIELIRKTLEKSGYHSPFLEQSYRASEVYYHMSGDSKDLKPYCVKHCGLSHWYLKDRDGVIIDVTSDQSKVLPDYSKGKGRAFVTRNLSRNARRLKLQAQTSNLKYTGFYYENFYRQVFFLNGRYHRTDGPAIIHHGSGFKEWWLYGNLLSAQEVFDQLTDEEKLKAIWELDQWR